MSEWVPVPVHDPPRPVLRFNEYGDLADFLNNSPHSVIYRNQVYPTALHLYEAHKFLDYNPEVAEQIRRSEVQWVTVISGRFADYMRRDWASIGLSTMDEVLYLKFSQHAQLRAMLLDTYLTELVYVEPKDPFWGVDQADIGMNELGNSLMRVRKRLRVEGGRLRN